ncbi:50S ribosomal protein L1 [Candidatus Thorarchaeota archaeon]|jgi:large subunit ribosomal protein L1|nr:MAG: 50S ribosomal protein L1 [Candidatus Thorarchaeota archaeon]
MSFNQDSIKEAVSEAREKGKERGINFEQSFDLAVNFRSKEMDVSKPENRFNQELVLPNRLYPPSKVCAFGDGEFADNAKEAGVDNVVSKDEIPTIGEEKKERKILAKSYDFFIAATDSMPLVGRYLGQVLGSRGKMPRPFPPQADLGGVVEQYQRTVRIKMRNTPTFHVKVGHETMDDAEIAENIEAILSFVDSKGHTEKVGSVVVKTTMGPPIEVESWR